MTILQIIDMKCGTDDSENTLRKALSKTKWLEKLDPEDISIEILLKVYLKVMKKYSVKIGYIQHSDEESFIAMIKSTETHHWIKTIYFVSWFEGMAKIMLALYAYTILGINMKDEMRSEDES